MDHEPARRATQSAVSTHGEKEHDGSHGARNGSYYLGPLCRVFRFDEFSGRIRGSAARGSPGCSHRRRPSALQRLGLDDPSAFAPQNGADISFFASTPSAPMQYVNHCVRIVAGNDVGFLGDFALFPLAPDDDPENPLKPVSSGVSDGIDADLGDLS